MAKLCRDALPPIAELVSAMITEQTVCLHDSEGVPFSVLAVCVPPCPRDRHFWRYDVSASLYNPLCEFVDRVDVLALTR
jgi:hypothetical protein